LQCFLEGIDPSIPALFEGCLKENDLQHIAITLLQEL
jgi:hypothetical protein